MIKLFAHRGFAKEGVLQNSIQSLENAYKTGFRAVEFDIWLCDGKLLLKHDRPKENENLPQLKDYFVFANQLDYWMDFKNLDRNNVTELLKLLKAEITAHFIDLNKIYFAPYITDHKLAFEMLIEFRKVFGQNLQFVAVCDRLDNQLEVRELRDFLSKNQIKFLSIFHKLINEDFIKNFQDIELFAWTVNEVLQLQRLNKLGVNNFATDEIIKIL